MKRGEVNLQHKFTCHCIPFGSLFSENFRDDQKSYLKLGNNMFIYYESNKIFKNWKELNFIKDHLWHLFFWVYAGKQDLWLLDSFMHVLLD